MMIQNLVMKQKNFSGWLLREYYVLHQDYYSKAEKLKQTSDARRLTLDAKNAFKIFDIRLVNLREEPQ